jgi:hypothetical protein
MSGGRLAGMRRVSVRIVTCWIITRYYGEKGGCGRTGVRDMGKYGKS